MNRALKAIAPALATLTALLPLMLSGCGGGADLVAGVPVTGGGSGVPIAAVGQGGVTQVSPVTVADLSFSYTPAQLSVEDGDDDGRGLQLGMVSRVQGGQGNFSPLGTSTEPGQATSITVNAELRGPAEVLPSAAALPQVRVMGILVRTSTATVYENVAPGLADVLSGQTLQVHGYPTPDGQIIATRVQRRSSNAVLKLTGTVSYNDCAGLCDPTGTVIRVGSMAWRVAPEVIRGLPYPLPEGSLVRIRTTTMPVAGAVQFASEVKAYAAPALLADASTSMRGVVAAPFASASESGFYLNGLRAVYDPAVSFSGGTRPDVSAGVLVEARGRHRDGVLTVTSLRLLPP